MRLRNLLTVSLLATALAFSCQTPHHDDHRDGGTSDSDFVEEKQQDDDTGEPDDTTDTAEPDDTADAGEPDEPDEPAPLLLVGIDGFKPSYLDTYEDQLPNLTEIADAGVRAESLKPVFPTHTFPNLYSIATGLYPENHGIISNTVYDPELDETMSLSNSDTHGDEKWWGGEPIWVTAERQGMDAGTFFWVGSEAPFDGVRPTHWVEYDSSISHRDRVEEVVEWLTDDDPVDFATLYFASPDGAGHEHGPDSSGVADTLRQLDNQIGRLTNRLESQGLWPDGINVLFVSDHGMTELDEDKVIFLDDIIDLSDVRVVDWTPVAMIRPHEGNADDVYDALEAAADDHAYSVYRRDELPDRYRLADNDRVPEILVIADKPYTLTNRSYFAQRGLRAGGHGYDPNYDQMHGFFLGHGPDLPDKHQTAPLHLVDLYALMTYLLELEPADHDGSLERITTELFDD